MIRQQFIVDEGVWKCAGCAAQFLPDGKVEHPANCPQMKPVQCKHLLVLESCDECMPRGPRSAQQNSSQDWQGLHYETEHTAGPRFGPWIEAQYHGVCGANFEHKVSPGDRIRADDELGEFVCEKCGSQGG